MNHDDARSHEISEPRKIFKRFENLRLTRYTISQEYSVMKIRAWATLV